MARKILTIIGLFIMITAEAQESLQFSFTQYTTTSGLISNQVNTISQDPDGYLWIGTTDGLQRYDGIRYKTFQHKENDSLSIPSNPVWQLLVDKKKNLWILLADGRVGIFDTHTFVFREVRLKFRKAISPNTFLKRLITDEFGNMFYLMGGSEVITWDEKTNEFSYTHNFFQQKEEWNIADFIQQPGTQKYWISREQGGLAVYDRATNTLSYSGANVEKLAPINYYGSTNTYHHLFFDREKRLWSFIWNGAPVIGCFDLNSSKPVIDHSLLNNYFKSYHEVKGFFQQQDGTIWIYGSLVFANYQEKNKHFRFVSNGYTGEKSISYQMIHCLFQDRENNIWVATDNNGMYRFNRSAEFFTNVHQPGRQTETKGTGSVLSFIATRRGSLLAGTKRDGLYQYDSGLNLIPLEIKGLRSERSPNVWDMITSRDSNIIWLSSQSGIYALDQKKRNLRFIHPDLLKNMTIRQLKEDKRGVLWMGTDKNGVYKWPGFENKKNSDQGPVSFSQIPAVPVNKMMLDSRGLLWVGTPENGLYVIDADSEKIHMHFGADEVQAFRLPENGISSILEYDDTSILITTATRVLKFDRLTKKIETIGRPGIISGFITAVERDREGYLWLTSTNGLYRINMQKGITIIFNRQDGIDNEQFSQSASHVLPDGRILFGTTNHFIAFDPNHIPNHPMYPDLHITDFRLMGRSLNIDSLIQLKEVTLSYKENALDIEFSTLMYANPFIIKYKMEGLDKDWKVADKNNQAVYNYLPSGSFTFLMKAMDAEGNESSKITGINIRVEAPFWKTVWFYSLVVLAIGFILYLLDMERTRRKEVIHNMRSDIASNLHDEVHIALGNINILSEMANLKAAREPQKSKEYIEQIQNRSNDMLIAMDDMLWSIKPENDSMEKAIERIAEHIDGLKNQYGVKINLLVDPGVKELRVNMILRKNVFWLLKGGITNIVRSGGGDCLVHIGVQKQNLVYTLEFDASQLDFQQMNNLLQRKELADKLDEVKGSITPHLQKTRPVIEMIVPLV